MTQSFDEWFIKKLGDRDETQPPFKIAKMWASGAYRAGAQSKQAEIDELRKRIDEAVLALEKKSTGLKGLVDNYNKSLNILKGTINEQ